MINFILGYEPWKNVMVFNYGGKAYLLQGAMNRWTKKIKFRRAKMSIFFLEDVSTLSSKEALKEAGFWE